MRLLEAAYFLFSRPAGCDFHVYICVRTVSFSTCASHFAGEFEGVGPALMATRRLPMRFVSELVSALLAMADAVLMRTALRTQVWNSSYQCWSASLSVLLELPAH